MSTNNEHEKPMWAHSGYREWRAEAECGTIAGVWIDRMNRGWNAYVQTPEYRNRCDVKRRGSPDEARQELHRLTLGWDIPAGIRALLSRPLPPAEGVWRPLSNGPCPVCTWYAGDVSLKRRYKRGEGLWRAEAGVGWLAGRTEIAVEAETPAAALQALAEMVDRSRIEISNESRSALDVLPREVAP